MPRHVHNPFTKDHIVFNPFDESDPFVVGRSRSVSIGGVDDAGGESFDKEDEEGSAVEVGLILECLKSSDVLRDRVGTLSDLLDSCFGFFLFVLIAEVCFEKSDELIDVCRVSDVVGIPCEDGVGVVINPSVDLVSSHVSECPNDFGGIVGEGVWL